MEKLKMGKFPSFFIHAYGLKYVNFDQKYHLVKPIEEVQTTLLRLELKADDLKYVTTVSDGTLKDVKIIDLSSLNILSVGV